MRSNGQGWWAMWSHCEGRWGIKEHLVAPRRAGVPPPALRVASNLLFQVPDLNSLSPESGPSWYTCRQLEKTTCSSSEGWWVSRRRAGVPPPAQDGRVWCAVVCVWSAQGGACGCGLVWSGLCAVCSGWRVRVWCGVVWCDVVWWSSLGRGGGTLRSDLSTGVVLNAASLCSGSNA